ncbi:hypothetical protein ADL25_33480 [Streptomyces sp. NRRL F-5122]|uniref:hypothetical protein n=1 Tax=Streptomyces sp. NRRL F-5122 TaxID=1609098 RepID=UPI000740F844|nr:hypothetical protein [Streptomyces sp. NRRL F-5122]KUJ36259.1 hypothetical protein ADL25_33480 [Streptomyces sp. NRRL F-5122]
MSTDEQAARGLADVEAYLYQEAHLSAARLRVAAFLAQSAGLSHRQIHRHAGHRERHHVRLLSPSPAT